MKIAVVGAGHAGVEAARVAAEQGARVTLYSAESSAPYFRPRLVAVAFHQAEPDSILMHPQAWYASHGMDLRLEASVKACDADTPAVSTADGTETVDGLVLATGARPVLPPFVAAVPERVLPLWDLTHALRIRELIANGSRLVVVGGGLIGVETALRAAAAGISVDLVERLPRLLSRQLAPVAAAVLERRLGSTGIGLHIGTGVAEAAAIGSGSRVRLRLEDGTVLDADACVLSIGVRPNPGPAPATIVGERGIRVDVNLRAAPRLFAAGDAIQLEGATRGSARAAAAQGRVAGANCVAALRGEPLHPYSPGTTAFSLKVGDVEVHTAGDIPPEHCEVLTLDGSGDSVLRALLVKDGRVVGVQMIGTRRDFDAHAARLGQPAISRA
jgi:NAD(P)H-nitrite reductase large subunit